MRGMETETYDAWKKLGEAMKRCAEAMAEFSSSRELSKFEHARQWRIELDRRARYSTPSHPQR